MPEANKSPSAAPIPKVAAVGITGAVSTILLWVLVGFGVSLPEELVAAIVTIITFAAGYITPPSGLSGS